MLTESVHYVGAQQGPPAELVAISDEGPITIARGIELGALLHHPPARLALGSPWAEGALIAARSAHVVRVVAVDRAGRPRAWAGEPGALESDPCDGEDSEALGLIWGLQDVELTTPTMRELFENLLLGAWLEGPITEESGEHAEVGVLELVSGNLQSLAKRVGVPPPRGRAVSPRLIVAGLHALDVAARMPLPGASRVRVLEELRVHIPPRWVHAHQLRRMGRPDLAELVMAATSESPRT